MEPIDQEDQPSAVGRKQPHQIALWLTICSIGIFYLCAILFESLAFAESLLKFITYLVSPVGWLIKQIHIIDSWGFVLVMVWGSIVTYLLFYVPVKLWMCGSRHLRSALITCALIAFATYLVFLWYSILPEQRPDWTSRGLDPNRPGFKAEVLVLAGEFDYWFRDSSINQTKSGKAYFEIRMRGSDYYYCRKWQGYDWRIGSWFRVEIANHGEGYSWGLARLSHTTRGTGGSWYGDHLLAQRLWDKNEFVGASVTNLIFEESKWPKRKEEFDDLTKIGRWLIPKHIRLTEPGSDQREENYYIKRIEFLPTPDTNWFDHVMAKYADHESEFRSVDLGEPGVSPNKRK